ncbi:MAG TPA: POTRA domain-containing protein, partial [Bacteroidia bacterium]|nr:POTRA domain-containing protein [Bacteroidia bacterium]
MKTLRDTSVFSFFIFFSAVFSCGNLSAQTDTASHKLKINSIISTELTDAVDSVPLDERLYEIRKISFSGNKKTKEFVMEREMTFHSGDTINGKDFHSLSDRSKKNLLNTSLFNFVTITYHVLPDTMRGQMAAIEVNVDVKERWYFWPTPIFEVSEQNVNTWWRNGHNFQRASYGFFLWKYNFRGRRESVALICRFGYSEQFGGQYAIPSFNKKGTLGATFTYTYTRGHEVAYATENNLLQFYKDPEHYLRAESVGSIRFNYRQGIYINHTLDLKYSNVNVRDTVMQIAPDYLANSSSLME